MNDLFLRINNIQIGVNFSRLEEYTFPMRMLVRSFAMIVTKRNFFMSKSNTVKVCSNEQVFEESVFYFKTDLLFGIEKLSQRGFTNNPSRILRAAKIICLGTLKLRPWH
jgi:hypothetical protein